MAKQITYRVLLFFVMVLFAACANRGVGPQGGPRDTIPPAIVKEAPLNGSVSYKGKSVEITFNEYIQLDDIQNNVMISPPQKSTPEIKAIGKKLSVVFQEELKDSTTYTIDFGAAICDYNEKTPLEGYVFAFATGEYIDSLSISGRLYDAANLNPKPAVLIGIHRNIDDSAFTTVPFERVTRTDSEGNFTIRNMRPGSYRLYALNDVSRDNLYQPGEGLAFYDSLVTPSFEVKIHHDTIWKDTLGIDVATGDTLFTKLVDSVNIHSHTHFYPDSLVLWYFEEDKKRLYHQSTSRKEQHAFTLIFSAPQDSMPVIKALRPSEVDSLASDSAWVDFTNYSLLQTSKNRDTITYWLTDSVTIKMDSIYMQMSYKITDSVYNLVPQIDTVLAVYRHPRISAKAMESYLRNKRNRKLELSTNASSAFDIYDTLAIVSKFPIDSIHDDMVRLFQKVDTTKQPIPIQLLRQDSLAIRFLIIAKLQPQTSYLLEIDSAACRDIYGAVNDELGASIQLKSLDEYASLKVKMSHYDAKARIQLLNEKDVVVRELPALPDGAIFKYLRPATYFIRLYIDHNGDEKWTTGDWLFKRQPEPIYYYPKKLKLRANWDFEEQFDHLSCQQVNSKPKALTEKKTKNKSNNHPH